LTALSHLFGGLLLGTGHFISVTSKNDHLQTIDSFIRCYWHCSSYSTGAKNLWKMPTTVPSTTV